MKFKLRGAHGASFSSAVPAATPVARAHAGSCDRRCAAFQRIFLTTRRGASSRMRCDAARSCVRFRCACRAPGEPPVRRRLASGPARPPQSAERHAVRRLALSYRAGLLHLTRCMLSPTPVREICRGPSGLAGKHERDRASLIAFRGTASALRPLIVDRRLDILAGLSACDQGRALACRALLCFVPWTACPSRPARLAFPAD